MNESILLGLLFWPMFVALACPFFRRSSFVTKVAVGAAWPLLIAGLWVAYQVFAYGPLTAWDGVFRVDALSAVLIAVIATVGFAATQVSAGYMRREVEHGALQDTRIWSYYTWLYLFLTTMILTCIVDNLGVMWVAIEATTLTSAVLVGFYSRPASLEAAWKYIILCSVGIALALFGIVLAYSSSVRALGESSGALRWTVLRMQAAHLDPHQLKLAFLFILIGFGTKAGLAPMHTWLPDAHSQSPSPISALLSGVLLSCALYGLLRFQAICTLVPGIGHTDSYLLGFGLFSIWVAVPFIFVQGDLKRLLAYSSVENIGLISLGVGLGGFWAIYGALLHLINHAFAKAMLFLTGGSLIQQFGSRRMTRIRGAIQAFPVTGTLFGLGILAIGGMPGFGPFLSEFTIAADGFRTGPFWAIALGLLGVVTAFAGLAWHGIPMVFGHAPQKIQGRERAGEWWGPGILLVLLVLLGFWIPGILRHGLTEAVQIVSGGRFQ